MDDDEFALLTLLYLLLLKRRRRRGIRMSGSTTRGTSQINKASFRNLVPTRTTTRATVSEPDFMDQESMDDYETKNVTIKEELHDDEGEVTYENNLENVADIVVKDEPNDDWSDPV